MFSDGSPTRTFCYIADAIIGYYKILVRGKNAESYNIGSDSLEISIRQLAERTVRLSKELFNYQGKLVFLVSDDEDYLTDNPNRRCPNSEFEVSVWINEMQSRRQRIAISTEDARCA